MTRTWRTTVALAIGLELTGCGGGGDGERLHRRVPRHVARGGGRGRHPTAEGRYLFAGDDSPGHVAGQGVDGVRWAVDPDGRKITDAPADGPDVPH